MYGEITCLSNSTGVCWASNSYFSELYGVDSSTVSRWITGLKNQGYITVDYKRVDGKKEIDCRYIKLNKVFLEPKEDGTEELTNF